MVFNFLRKKPHKASGIDPSSQTQPGIVSPPTPKTLAELEKEMEAQFIATRPHTPSPQAKSKGGLLGKIKWAAILIGIPVGVVWVANLPYPMIRRPVAQKAPILLLPSYMSMDNNYRQARAEEEQAEQLVNNATSPADLDLGDQKLKEAQKHLDALPVSFLNDWPEYRY